jgi:hypothetical protein
MYKLHSFKKCSQTLNDIKLVVPFIQAKARQAGTEFIIETARYIRQIICHSHGSTCSYALGILL